MTWDISLRIRYAIALMHPIAIVIGAKQTTIRSSILAEDKRLQHLTALK